MLVFTKLCGWPPWWLDIPGCQFGDSASVVWALQTRKRYFQIRPVVGGGCIGGENTRRDDKWKYFLCGGSNHFGDTKFKSRPTYVYSDLWLKFYTCLYYTWIGPAILWIADGETWNHSKMILFQVWFPKRGSDNSCRMFTGTWASVYNSPGLNPGKFVVLPHCDLKLWSKKDRRP